MEYLLGLRKTTMNEHLLRAGLSISDEEHIKRILYQYEGAEIILLNAEPIGLLKLNRQPTSIEIIQIQIDPQYQGKGIGQEVIQFIIDQAREQQISVSLSVLKGNKAKRLYESLGFVTIEETEDSFVMKI